MGCCGQNTTGAGAAAVDTGKRVNYTKGMLLGVDDFVQDQAYEIAHRHELARELLGYGTVRGLQVIVEDDAGGPRVRVTPGMAWLPSGTPVCVPSEQCCSINDWLLKHGADYASQVSGSSSPLTLYVVLSYAECLTDKVPIPGEPCRSEDELMQDSRIADCFRLELRLAPPAQIEEDAVRDFADWLAKVPVDPTSPPLSESAFLDQLRAAAHDWLVPTSPHPGDFMFGSPPAGLGTDDALMRAALRLWVTELRPLWRARYGCGPDATPEGGSDDAVLLAALGLNLVKGGHWEADGPVAILEDQRPVLLSLRMVQELITQNPAPEPGNSVTPANAFGLPAGAGSDSAYSRADHSHGTPVLPQLVGDATGPIGGNTVVKLQGRDLINTVAPTDKQALIYNTAAPGWKPGMPDVSTHAMAGDVTGTIGNNKVEALRNVPLADVAPTPGNVLIYAKPDGWAPGTPDVSAQAMGGDVTGTVAASFVGALRNIPIAAAAPAVGQALFFTKDKQWTPGSFDASTQTLAGDVGGTLGANTVQGLQGVAVVKQQPKDGQVLVYSDAVSARVGTGAGWIPQTLSTNFDLAGDVTGDSGKTSIAALQGTTVAATGRKKGDVLTFDGTQWVPLPATGASAGGASIVLAGEVMVTIDSGKPSSSPAPRITRSFGSLSVKLSDVNVASGMIRVDVHAMPATPATGGSGYIVKLTPTLPKDYLVFGGSEPPRPSARAPLFFTYAAGEVIEDTRVEGQINLSVILFPAGDISGASFDFIFQIEVTRFGVA